MSLWVRGKYQMIHQRARKEVGERDWMLYEWSTTLPVNISAWAAYVELCCRSWLFKIGIHSHDPTLLYNVIQLRLLLSLFWLSDHEWQKSHSVFLTFHWIYSRVRQHVKTTQRTGRHFGFLSACGPILFGSRQIQDVVKPLKKNYSVIVNSHDWINKEKHTHT